MSSPLHENDSIEDESVDSYNSETDSSEEISDSDEDIGQQSREKAAACKFAIEQFYDNFFKSMNQRLTRLVVFYSKCKSNSSYPIGEHCLKTK